MNQRALAGLIASALATPFKIDAVTPISSGPLWQVFRIDNARTGTPSRLFAKLGREEHLPIFAAEADGLNRLRAAGEVLRVPGSIACKRLEPDATADAAKNEEGEAVLLLEWIDLLPLDPAGAATLGEGLAQLHRTTSDTFGLECDNFIGATPQRNTPDADWVRFWQLHRLMPQLALAARHRYPSRMIDRGERLAADCGALFGGYRPVPSLLHGDLWSGNVAADAAGRPVIFDPAAYYGDREADIAMTELFGRQPPDFYAAYDNAWQRDVGCAVRRDFYNLYHVLNHANLFAGDYVRQCERMIEALLAEL